MRRGRICQNLFLAVLVAGLASCDSKKGEEVAGSSPGEESVISGVWENRYTQGTELESRFYEWDRSGRFMECYREDRIDSSGKILATGTVCDTGTWSDQGAVSSLYRNVGRWVNGWTEIVPMIENSRMVRIRRQHGNTTPARHFAGVDGFTLARMADSLVFTGQFFVYNGDRGGRLDSTVWVRPGARVDSLYLDARGNARAKIEATSNVQGTWRDSLGILIAEFAWNDPLGMRQTSRIDGAIGLQGNSLVLFEVIDPVGFHKLIHR